MRLRMAIGLGLLAAQIAMIGVARFHPMRYFCWAPYDSQIEYAISAQINGAQLSPSDIELRYRLPAQEINPRMICQVTDVIAHVERFYHPADDSRVRVMYRTNGGPETEWSWPSSSAN